MNLFRQGSAWTNLLYEFAFSMKQFGVTCRSPAALSTINGVTHRL
jgi:hypothetical protein